MRTLHGVMAALALCLVATFAPALHPTGDRGGYCLPPSAIARNVCVLLG